MYSLPSSHFSISLPPLFFSKTAKLDGRTCEYNNKIYQNGEIFRPNCKHQCTCMDGAVGCVSLCPHELMLPKLGCAKPRRIKIPGRCCEQLVCPEEAKTESESVMKKQRRKHSKDSRLSEDDFTNRNELGPVWRGDTKSLPGEQFYTIWWHLEPNIRSCMLNYKRSNMCIRCSRIIF